MCNQLWRGIWWVAGENAEPRPGTMSMSPTGKIELDLIGGFDLSVRTPIEGGVAISRGPLSVPRRHALQRV